MHLRKVADYNLLLVAIPEDTRKSNQKNYFILFLYQIYAETFEVFSLKSSLLSRFELSLENR